MFSTNYKVLTKVGNHASLTVVHVVGIVMGRTPIFISEFFNSQGAKVNFEH